MTFTDNFTDKQIRYNKLFMRLAWEVASISHANKRKVGAIAVRDGSIIDFGFNGMPTGFNNCCEDKHGETLPNVIHAEDNLIRKCKNNGKSLEGSTVFITKEPCVRCGRLLVVEGVCRVFYDVCSNSSRPGYFRSNLGYLTGHQLSVEPTQRTPLANPPGDAKEQKGGEEPGQKPEPQNPGSAPEKGACAPGDAKEQGYEFPQDILWAYLPPPPSRILNASTC